MFFPYITIIWTVTAIKYQLYFLSSEFYACFISCRISIFDCISLLKLHEMRISLILFEHFDIDTAPLKTTYISYAEPPANRSNLTPPWWIQKD